MGVTLNVNIRVDTEMQFERSSDGTCALVIVDRLDLYPRTVSVQGCRKRTFARSLCTAWSNFQIDQIGQWEYQR